MKRREPVLEFIRHGLPEGGHRYRGSGVDDPLSDVGWEQMWRAMADDSDWDRVVTSPLLRCRQFAEAFSERHGLSMSVMDGLAEIRFGAWEGKTKADLTAIDDRALDNFYLDPVAHAPVGAEPVAQFQRRVETQLHELLARYAGQRVLVVCHAGIMRVIIALVLDSPLQTLYRMSIHNAQRFTLVPGEPLTIRL